MGNDDFQLREVLEHVGHHQLLETGGIGAEVMRAGGVEAAIAGRANVNHRRDIVLDHLLVDRVEGTVCQRRTVPVAAARVRIQVDADEAHLLDGANDLRHRLGRIDARRLRQLRHRHEVVREQIADAADQVVLVLAPELAGVFISDMVTHPAGTWRENGEVGAAFLLQAQLVVHDALANLIIADDDLALFTDERRVFGDGRHLFLAIHPYLRRRGGVMAMTIDNHCGALFSGSVSVAPAGGH